MANVDILPTINPIYRRPVVSQVTGDSRSTLYRKIKDGLFTKPVKLGSDKRGNACQVGWPYNEVKAIVDARIAGKSDDEIKSLVKQLELSRNHVAGFGR